MSKDVIKAVGPAQRDRRIKSMLEDLEHIISLLFYDYDWDIVISELIRGLEEKRMSLIGKEESS